MDPNDLDILILWGVIAGVLFGSAGAFSFSKRLFRAQLKKVKVLTAKDDEPYYFQAAREFDTNRSAELWANSLTSERGDTDQAKYRYIELRVPQLKLEMAKAIPHVEPEETVNPVKPRKAKSSFEEQLEQAHAHLSRIYLFDESRFYSAEAMALP